MDAEMDKRAHATDDGRIPCVTWDLHHNPMRLSPIPSLPKLGEERDDVTKLVKIAGMDSFLIGLTNKGHVLKFGSLANESTTQTASWEYVSPI